MADLTFPRTMLQKLFLLAALLLGLFWPGPSVFSAEPHAGHAPPPAQNASSASPSAGREFTVRAAPPAGIPIASNVPAVPPPSMVERLGEVLPEGIVLRDETGALVDARSLTDLPVLVAPVFLTCPAACNTLQSSLAASLPKVNLTPGKDYRVLVVSFDDNDTSALAARKKQNYLAAMNFAFPSDALRYLTGDAASIKRFMDALGFPFIRVGPGNFSHPLGLIVLAPGGKIVRYLYGQGFLPFDLTMALSEAAKGQSGLSIKRVLAYCFSYDPKARGYVFNVMRMAGLVIVFGAGVLLFILLRGGQSRRKTEGE